MKSVYMENLVSVKAYDIIFNSLSSFSDHNDIFHIDGAETKIIICSLI